MNRFSLADKTLRLLAAQVNLNGTFRHSCSFKNTNLPLILVLQVERGSSGTLFTIVTGDEKHSLTVNDANKDKHLVLADFIESIATGRMDTAEPAIPRVHAESTNAAAGVRTGHPSAHKPSAITSATESCRASR